MMKSNSQFDFRKSTAIFSTAITQTSVDAVLSVDVEVPINRCGFGFLLTGTTFLLNLERSSRKRLRRVDSWITEPL